MLNTYFSADGGQLRRCLNIVVRWSKNSDNARLGQVTLTYKSSSTWNSWKDYLDVLGVQFLVLALTFYCLVLFYNFVGAEVNL